MSAQIPAASDAIPPSMFNRVAFRVGDEAHVCRWGLTDEDRAAAAETVLVAGEDGEEPVARPRGEDSLVVVREVRALHACTLWTEGHHAHVLAEGPKRGPVERCSGVLSPWRRVLRAGDLVRVPETGMDLPVTAVTAEGFSYAIEAGERWVPWARAAGTVHADGLEIGRPLSVETSCESSSRILGHGARI